MVVLVPDAHNCDNGTRDQLVFVYGEQPAMMCPSVIVATIAIARTLRHILAEMLVVMILDGTIPLVTQTSTRW